VGECALDKLHGPAVGKLRSTTNGLQAHLDSASRPERGLHLASERAAPRARRFSSSLHLRFQAWMRPCTITTRGDCSPRFPSQCVSRQLISSSSPTPWRSLLLPLRGKPARSVGDALAEVRRASRSVHCPCAVSWFEPERRLRFLGADRLVAARPDTRPGVRLLVLTGPDQCKAWTARSAFTVPLLAGRTPAAWRSLRAPPQP